MTDPGFPIGGARPYHTYNNILTIFIHTNRCKHLKELHVVDSKLKTENLVNAIANRRGLQAISFTVSSFTELKSQKFVIAKDALKTVNRLEVHILSNRSGKGGG